MFCSKCGATLAGDSRFCSQCGQAMDTAPAAPMFAGSPLYSQGKAVAPLPDAPTSGKALASVVFGIIGLLLFPIAVVAIILGHISRSEIQRSQGRIKGLGLSTAGLVMGYGAFAMIPVVLILAAIAIPNLLRARIAANEASAVAAIRTLNNAETSYLASFPDAGYTCQLANLGGSSGSAPSAEHAQLIDDTLASGQRAGYVFELRNCINSETEGHKYQVLASPVKHNSTGRRAFCSDESGVIRTASGASPEECLTNGSPLE
jgi:type IV pilus assembly protein PilA